MIVREYKLWHHTSQATNKITKFSVSDALNVDDDRPSLVEFPVSVAHTSDVQRARAKEYADYMNRIVEATQNAYSENLLADKLKGTI